MELDKISVSHKTRVHMTLADSQKGVHNSTFGGDVHALSGAIGTSNIQKKASRSKDSRRLLGLLPLLLLSLELVECGTAGFLQKTCHASP